MNDNDAELPELPSTEETLVPELLSTGEHLVHESLTGTILGAFFATHSYFGHGFLEPVYANAVALLLRRADLRVEREVPFDVEFHGKIIGRYRADLVVESKVIVETKAARVVNPAHTAQLLNYLRTANLDVGLLLNFGLKAEFRRVVSTVGRR